MTSNVNLSSYFVIYKIEVWNILFSIDAFKIHNNFIYSLRILYMYRMHFDNSHLLFPCHLSMSCPLLLDPVSPVNGDCTYTGMRTFTRALANYQEPHPWEKYEFSLSPAAVNCQLPITLHLGTWPCESLSYPCQNVDWQDLVKLLCR